MSVKLFLKDNSNGAVHEYGTNRHDALILQEDGSLHYENMQNCTGTMFPDEGYSFCLKDGNDPLQSEEYLRFGIGAYLDIGGEQRGRSCMNCKWSGRGSLRCLTCKDNPNIHSRYEPYEGAVIL